MSVFYQGSVTRVLHGGSVMSVFDRGRVMRVLHVSHPNEPESLIGG